jgi:hypothetical protein
MLHRGATQWLARLDEGLSLPATPRARLSALAEALLEFANEQPRWVELLLQEGPGRGEFGLGLAARLGELLRDLGGSPLRTRTADRIDAAVGLSWGLAARAAQTARAELPGLAGLLADLWLRVFR